MSRLLFADTFRFTFGIARRATVWPNMTGVMENALHLHEAALKEQARRDGRAHVSNENMNLLEMVKMRFDATPDSEKRKFYLLGWDTEIAVAGGVCDSINCWRPGNDAGGNNER